MKLFLCFFPSLLVTKICRLKARTLKDKNEPGTKEQWRDGGRDELWIPEGDRGSHSKCTHLEKHFYSCLKSLGTYTHREKEVVVWRKKGNGK